MAIDSTCEQTFLDVFWCCDVSLDKTRKHNRLSVMHFLYLKTKSSKISEELNPEVPSSGTLVGIISVTYVNRQSQYAPHSAHHSVRMDVKNNNFFHWFPLTHTCGNLSALQWNSICWFNRVIYCQEVPKKEWTHVVRYYGMRWWQCKGTHLAILGNSNSL